MALPRMVNDKRLKHVQWHLQEQRQRLHENVLLRKSILEANYARQVQVEKDAIRSSIARMQLPAHAARKTKKINKYHDGQAEDQGL